MISRRQVLRYGGVGLAALAARPAFGQTIGPGTGLPVGYRKMTENHIQTRRGSWVTAHLMFETDHDAENTEGEPGLLFADGELIGGQIDAWGYPQTVTWQTNKSGLLMQTAVLENVSGTVDNFAKVYFTVDGNYAFGPEAKAYAARNQTNLNIMASMAGGAAAVAFLTPGAPAGLVLASTGVALGILAAILGKIVADPPDEHYWWREWPDFGQPTWVYPGDNASSELAAYVNHMSYCLVPCLAYAQAALVSSNRATGAHERGDTDAENWQLAIATEYKREMIPRLWEAFDALRKVIWLIRQEFNVDLQPNFISTTPLQGQTGEANPRNRATRGQEMFAQQVRSNSPLVQWMRESLRNAKLSEDEIAFMFSQLENPRWPWLGLVDQSKLLFKLPTTSLVPANPQRFNGSITPSSLSTVFPDCLEQLLGDDWANLLVALEQEWRV